MKKFGVIFGLVSFATLLIAGSALSQITELTGCFKDGKKNSKINRVSSGPNPGKDCKNQQTEVTWPTTEVTDDLQEQILLGDEALQLQIDKNAADIADNAADIADLKATGISSMIGGGHNSSADGADTFYMPLYNWFRLGSNAEAASKVAVTGWLTNLVVIQNESTGADALQEYRYIVDGVPVDLSPLVANNFCTTTGDSGDASTMCESSGCFKINMGDTLSVRVVAVTTGDDPNVSPTRWTGRFVETDADCPVLEP